MGELEAQKVLVVGAGPVGALAALYAGKRGDDVHVYELRDGELFYTCLFQHNIPLVIVRPSGDSVFIQFVSYKAFV